jgi:hypothetical protein
MLRTIILLTGTVRQQHALASLLREHNPGLSFCSAMAVADLTALGSNILRDAKLICFANDAAFPETFLMRLGHGAYKFYAAPMQYPGLPAEPDEIADDARCFSAIAESMTIWPDSRRVVGLETFTIPEGTASFERERLVFARLAYLFWRMSGLIACEATDLPGIIDATESKGPTLALLN